MLSPLEDVAVVQIQHARGEKSAIMMRGSDDAEMMTRRFGLQLLDLTSSGITGIVLPLWCWLPAVRECDGFDHLRVSY
jgi:hypothetical protein